MRWAVLLAVLAGCMAENCPRSEPAFRSEENVIEDKIIKTHYDKTVRPVKNVATAIEVTLSLSVNSITLHDWYSHTLILTGDITYTWKDEFIQWNKDWYGIEEIVVPSDIIWVPDIIATMPSRGSYDIYRISNHACTVKYTGDVNCTSYTSLDVWCSMNIQKWPFDVHNCSVMFFFLWSHSSEVTFSPVSGKLSLNNLENDSRWMLSSVETTFSARYHMSQYSFIVKRRGFMFVTTDVIPAAIVPVLLLLAFWAKASSAERIAVVCINIFLHIMYLHHLGYTLPNNGTDIPLIVKFYRDSLFLVIISLLEAALIYQLNSVSFPPPAWLLDKTNWVTALPVGQFLRTRLDPTISSQLLDEDVEENGSTIKISKKETANEWGDIIALMDWFLLIVFVITYIIMIVCLITWN